jgi:hypothetical protein
MKKRVLLFSTVGIVAGALYTLETKRRKHATAAEASAGNGQTAAVSRSKTEKSTKQRGPSMGAIEDGRPTVREKEARIQIDDHGTNQAAASQILRDIRDNGFDASDERLALALGRPTEEIQEWVRGDGVIDGDVVMKARALAIQRGLEVE